MKKIVLTLGVFFVIIATISCVRTEKDNLTSSKSHEYYTNYFKKELIKNGIENTEYFQTGINADKKAETEEIYKNLSHSQIMSNLDESILIIKKEFEEAVIYHTKEVNLLISTIKEYNLVDKGEFYKKLLDANSDIERTNLHCKERNKYCSKLEKARINNDVNLTLKLIDKYSYLNLLTRDKEGIYVFINNISPDKKEGLRYSIEKYDVVYKNKKKEEEKRRKAMGIRHTRYVNGMKVE